MTIAQNRNTKYHLFYDAGDKKLIENSFEGCLKLTFRAVFYIL